MEIIDCEKIGDVIPDRKVEKSCVKEQFGHICENYLVLLITKINKKFKTTVIPRKMQRRRKYYL